MDHDAPVIDDANVLFPFHVIASGRRISVRCDMQKPCRRVAPNAGVIIVELDRAAPCAEPIGYCALQSCLRKPMPCRGKAGIADMTDIVVAERIFRDAISGASVTARIFAPRKSEDSSDWSCKIDIEGLAAPFQRSIFGVDSFQALELATSLLCTILERHEANLAFLDGPPGDCALPLIAFCPSSVKADAREFIRGKIEVDRDSHHSAIELPPAAQATHAADSAVAERVFRDSISGASVTARMFTPEQTGQSEWSCKVTVQGLAIPFETSALGVDSFQSLYLGLRLLCAHLEKYEANLAFPGGAQGDGSLPLVALCLPPSLKPDVHRFVEAKIRDHLNSHG